MKNPFIATQQLLNNDHTFVTQHRHRRSYGCFCHIITVQNHRPTLHRQYSESFNVRPTQLNNLPNSHLKEHLLAYFCHQLPSSYTLTFALFILDLNYIQTLLFHPLCYLLSSTVLQAAGRASSQSQIEEKNKKLYSLLSKSE